MMGTMLDVITWIFFGLVALLVASTVVLFASYIYESIIFMGIQKKYPGIHAKETEGRPWFCMYCARSFPDFIEWNNPVAHYDYYHRGRAVGPEDEELWKI